MPEPIKFGKIDVNLVSSMTEGRSVPDEDTPFRILVLGDFSGRANRSLVDSRIAVRKPLLVDRDNIDDVLAKLNVEIVLPVPGKDGAPLRLTFADLEDFHPDRLYERLGIFDSVDELRKNLKDPEIVAALAGREASPAPLKEPAKPSQPVQSSGSLLDQIMDDAQGGKAADEPFQGEPQMQRFLKDITEPHLVARAHPRQAELMASADDLAGEMMRIILHHPDFQALESLWRGLNFLVMRLDTDENLKIFLLDVSKEELAADIMSSDDLTKTGIYKILAGEAVKTFGSEPWAAVAGQYRFGDETGDVQLLGRLARIAMVGGAPFIAAAEDTILGCKSLAQSPDPDDWRQTDGQQAWAALRALPEAGYLGLAMPRFLLRLPYGEKTEPLESFPFEEMSAPPVHDEYLWGNPACACAYLLGRAFLEEGWSFAPGQVTDLEGMPLHVYKDQGESAAKPCAEVALTERAAERIMDKGVMLFLSYRNQDVIRLARFQSLADPPANLGGRWG